MIDSFVSPFTTQKMGSWSIWASFDWRACHVWKIAVKRRRVSVCEGVDVNKGVFVWKTHTPSSPPFTLLICEARKMEREHSFWKKCSKLFAFTYLCTYTIQKFGPNKIFYYYLMLYLFDLKYNKIISSSSSSISDLYLNA